VKKVPPVPKAGAYERNKATPLVVSPNIEILTVLDHDELNGAVPETEFEYTTMLLPLFDNPRICVPAELTAMAVTLHMTTLQAAEPEGAKTCTTPPVSPT